MAKRLFKIVLSLAIIQLALAFSACVGAQTKSINEVGYCSIFNPTLTNHESQIVKTRVLMTYSTVSRVDGGDSFFYSPECNNGDYFAIPESAEKKNPWRKWQGVFSKLAKEKDYVFEIKLTGKLKTRVFPQFGHLGWSRNQFEVIAIETIKNITTKAVEPDSKAETPLTDEGEALKTINTEVMFYFAGKRSDISDYIAEKFVVNDVSGNGYNEKNYFELAEKGLFGNIEAKKLMVSNGQLKYESGAYKVFGYIANGDITDKWQALDFESTYQYTNNSWRLTEIKFSKP